MMSIKTTTLIIILGLILCFSTGGALAGTTSTQALPFARELASANAAYTLPSSTVLRNMGVARGAGGNFLVDVVLTGGAVWNSSGTPTGSSLTISTSSVVTYGTIRLVSDPSGVSTASYLIPITTGVPASPPTLTFTATGLQVKDVLNVIGTGGTIQVRVQTRDATTGEAFDVGSETADFMIGTYGVTVSNALLPGEAVIDITAHRTKFLNDLTTDSSASIGIDAKSVTAYDRNGAVFTLTSADSIEYRVSGDLNGIATIAWGNAAKNLGAADVSAGSTAFTIPGDNINVSGATHGERRLFTLTVSGTTPLNSRTLSITATLKLSGFASRVLVQRSTLTIWSLNGTVLLANWMNGNSAVLNSRIYLWNKNGQSGVVTVSVYSLPNSAAGSVLLGSLQWGNLAGRSGVNIKLAEDVLAPLGVALPYTDNGGNLILEIAVQAFGIVGVTQTFTGNFAYGTYPLAPVN